VIVVDTHALLWWALDPDHLSGEAQKQLSDMERDGGFASAISIWELAIKVKRKKLELPLSVDEFKARVERGGVVQLVPVDADLWLRSVALPWSHSDPADRVIVATALALGLPLLTKDSAMHAYEGVKAVW
jgi:PIN domain nuclease of toxin-antitoxin system